MKHLGQRGAHAGTFTRRENDHMQGHSKPGIDEKKWRNHTSSLNKTLPLCTLVVVSLGAESTKIGR